MTDVAPPVCLTQRTGRVMVITMNRPRQRNALNSALRQAMRDAFDEFEQDPELRCAVLTGEGPAFCAGGDLKEMASTQVTVPPAEWSLLMGSRGRVDKPVIAAVNGFAFAGGFRLVQDCDLAIASDTAQLGITEVKRGRGAPWAVPMIGMVSKRVMLEILLTGEPISAGRAHQVGLVNHVVAPEDLLTTALRMANVIADNAPLSVAAARQMVELSTELGVTDARREADRIYEAVYLSDDALEGPRAFAEGRQPVWTGR
jgi:enoyl-CoA hydratase